MASTRSARIWTVSTIAAAIPAWSSAYAQEAAATDPPASATPAAAPAEPVAVPVALPLAVASKPTPPAADHAMWVGGISALATGQQVSTFSTDAGGALSPDSVQTFGRLRLSLALDSGASQAVTVKGGFAAELASGSWGDVPQLFADRAPGSDLAKSLPAEGWLGLARGQLGEVRAGLMASHWGLGLLANDGKPQDLGWFTVPRIGDRVVRGALVLTPWRGQRSALAGLVLSLALDDVFADELKLAGDEAQQAVAALRWFTAADRWVGFYYAGRSQTHTSGRRLDAHAFDLATDLAFTPSFGSLRLQGEAVLLAGSTTLAPSPDFPEHAIEQAAVLLRATAKGTAGWLAQLDAGWFSGDTSLDDGKVQGFRADPNFQMGMLLFPQVLAWQSGRARLAASDPDLVGRPADDLERLASGGAVGSAVAIFPKIGWNAWQGLEIYAGALLALSPSPLTDPRASRTEGGGDPRNFLGKIPDGSYLGTELAGGFRLRFAAPRRAGQLVIGAEVAQLLPGGVLKGLENVSGMRVTAGWLPSD